MNLPIPAENIVFYIGIVVFCVYQIIIHKKFNEAFEKALTNSKVGKIFEDALANGKITKNEIEEIEQIIGECFVTSFVRKKIKTPDLYLGMGPKEKILKRDR